jgi:hypothetical protein
MAKVKLATLIAKTPVSIDNHLSSEEVTAVKTASARLQTFTHGMTVENVTTWLSKRSGGKGAAAIDASKIHVARNEPGQIFAMSYVSLQKGTDGKFSRIGEGQLTPLSAFPSSDDTSIIHLPTAFLIVPVGTEFEAEVATK